MEKKAYYPCLDWIRVISCFGVLFYHLGLLKSGYLAVCTFFVLTGYLSYVSAHAKEKFSPLAYYKSRFLSIYLPLFFVTFLTVFIFSFVTGINWLNLKPETTSVIFGYNNYWQLGANLDYFTRHVDSPFMHFWYIGILLQFELVFPFFFLLAQKIEKNSKKCWMILFSFFTVGSMGYFLYQSFRAPIMVLYYDTFTRVFSILFGILLGILHTNGVKKYLSPGENYIFYSYGILLISSFFLDLPISFSLLFITILSGRLITYGTLSTKTYRFSPILSFISKMSYEIYLVQYPVIFFLQELPLPKELLILLMIGCILILSVLLHFAFSIFKKQNRIAFFLFGILSFFSIFGLLQYCGEKDHTAEMNALEVQLQKNKELMKEKQKQYTSRLSEEKDVMNQSLEEIQMNIQNLSITVSNLPIVGIGDSVMLGAVPNLYEKFPNGYFDAETSRTDWEASKILQNLKNNGYLGDPILINLGTNGQCGEKCRLDILSICEDRQIFWINVTNDREVHVNYDLIQFSLNHPQVTILDWASYSSGHYEYFIADGIHLTGSGKEAYTNFIYQTICDTYLKIYQAQEEMILHQYEEELNQKIFFYGNDLLLNTYDSLKTRFGEEKVLLQYETDYSELIQDMKDKIEKKELPKRIAFVFDKTLPFTMEQKEEIQKILDNYEVLILSLEKKDSTMYFPVKDSYYMPDDIHFNEEGNQALVEFLYAYYS